MKKIIQTILATALIFTLFSCTNILERNSDLQENKSADGETYLIIGATNIKKTTSRSIGDQTYSVNPDRNDAVPSKLTNLILTGREINSTSTTMATLAETDTLEELLIQKIKIQPGAWIFKLSAEIDGIIYSSDNVEQTIYEGQYNTVKFILTSEAKYGGLEISVEWKNIANKVVATLMDATETETVATKTFTDFNPIDDTTSSITFGRDIKKDEEQIPSGTYYLKFEFYNDTTPNATDVFDYYDAYINIADGLTTRSTFEIELKKTFEIQYEANGGSLAEGETQPKKYSLKSSDLPLPVMKKPGYFWGGWYENEDFSGEPVTAIPAGTGIQKTYYAKWNEPVLYVSGTGDDPTGDGTEANPFESIDKACEKIIETGDSEMDWVIYIMGDVTGPHTSNNKAGSRGENPSTAGDTDFGRTVIPADITSDYAKSILLIGKTGLDTNGYPQDMLNRGLVQNNSTSYKDTGNVIAIATTVPVTIKNLKITGGNNSSPYSNSTNDPYYQNGGGLNVAPGANVTLDDGVLITKNKAYNGGAVYNAGTLTMVGSATIGDSSVTTYPQKGITATADLTTGKYPASNEYKYGGGIYNTGTLYLGIPGTSGKQLTGGIYNSYGDTAFGGGIYNSGNGSVVMSSGKINYNDGQSNGGGVYLNSGTFKMTGGEIFYNSTGDQGGGVYVNSGAVFYFGGGTISGNNANTYGGGVYIKGESSGSGKMFMYGDAVIGKASATSQAPEIIAGDTAEEKVAMETGCNMATYGAGIYAQGELYMGYSDQDVTKPLTGGIFYNTAKKNVNYGYSNGGALYVTGSYANVIMNSGTINYNYAKEGPGIFITSNYFTMTSLTVGDDKYVPIISQNIGYSEYYYSINIDSLLASAATGAYNLVPPKNNDETGYSSIVSLIKPTAAATAQNITINDIKDKFTVEPFTNPKTGISTNWIINSSGKPVQKAETINVSSSGTYTSISDAVAQMNDDTKDYIISISGIITGPQTIPGTVLANSITIKGATTTDATKVPNNGIDASLGNGEAGTVLTIDTSVPVTLNNICVKGGHGTEKNGVIIGGGLLLGQNAHVCLDNNTRILQNITYDKNDGTPGYGAGVFISDGAKLYENSDCHITENTATSKGAGIYIAACGCLQTMAESGSYVTLNTFDTNFKDSNNQSITPCGGAVYIEDNATLEMFGAWFRDNCQDVDNCLGSGIFLSANGNLKASGHTEVVVPNDIYLQDGAQIEIAAAISPTNPSQYTTPNITARLTPEIYAEGKTLLKSATGLSANTFTNALQKFEILTQDISGQKQYWTLNTSGQLQKNAGTGISVTIPGNTQNDIEVTISSGDGGPIEGNTHFTGGSTLVFTVTDQTNFSNCEWTIDGEEEDPTNEYSLSVDTSGWAPGTYVVYLEAQDKNGKYYSYTAQIKVGN